MTTKTENMSPIFHRIQRAVYDKMRCLDSHLTYHNIPHTMDVLEQCERLAKEEGITDDRTLFLLKLAALYHDTGFLETYANHEAESCRIFLSDATEFELTEAEKKMVTDLIMATKLPQSPKTLCERIICDADLDYLGRPDFLRIGDGLRKEFLHVGIVASNEEWEQLQLKFLSNHSYHTETARRTREEAKQQHLSGLR